MFFNYHISFPLIGDTPQSHVSKNANLSITELTPPLQGLNIQFFFLLFVTHSF